MIEAEKEAAIVKKLKRGATYQDIIDEFHVGQYTVKRIKAYYGIKPRKTVNQLEEDAIRARWNSMQKLFRGVKWAHEKGSNVKRVKIRAGKFVIVGGSE